LIEEADHGKYTCLDLSEYVDLLAKYIPDWNSESPGAELGSLKCECTDEIEKILKKKHGLS